MTTIALPSVPWPDHGRPRPPRPSTVAAGAYLLAGAAAFWLGSAIATLFAVPQYRRYYADLQQDRDGGSLVGSLLTASAPVAAVIALLALLLARHAAQGRRSARVLVVVLCVLGTSTAVVLAGLDLFVAVPWHRWWMLSTCILTAVLLVTTVVLLALPASNRYYRPPTGPLGPAPGPPIWSSGPPPPPYPFTPPPPPTWTPNP